MLSNPEVGQAVELRYSPGRRRLTHLHGKAGTVVVRGKGRPRNHGVMVEGTLYVVPAGQLRKAEGR